MLFGTNYISRTKNIERQQILAALREKPLSNSLQMQDINEQSSHNKKGICEKQKGAKMVEGILIASFSSNNPT